MQNRAVKDSTILYNSTLSDDFTKLLLLTALGAEYMRFGGDDGITLLEMRFSRS